MKLSKIIATGTACVASVVVSAMEFPTLRLTPSRPRGEAAAFESNQAAQPQASCAAPFSSNSHTPLPAGSALSFHGSSRDLNANPSVDEERSKLQFHDGAPETQRVFDLQRQLHDCQLREVEYKHRLQDVERQLVQKNTMLAQAIREMNSTRQELIIVKTQLEGWSKNMNDLRERLRSTEADNRATTQTFVQLLQEFLQVEPNTPQQPLDREKMPLQAPSSK